MAAPEHPRDPLAPGAEKGRTVRRRRLVGRRRRPAPAGLLGWQLLFFVGGTAPWGRPGVKLAPTSGGASARAIGPHWPTGRPRADPTIRVVKVLAVIGAICVSLAVVIAAI